VMLLTDASEERCTRLTVFYFEKSQLIPYCPGEVAPHPGHVQFVSPIKRTLAFMFTKPSKSCILY
jgi:hypothetical protein